MFGLILRPMFMYVYMHLFEVYAAYVFQQQRHQLHLYIDFDPRNNYIEWN